MKKLLTISLAAGLLAIGATAFAQPNMPDLIVVNGKIATVDKSNTMVQAMAIKDDVILKTGTNAEIEAMAGPNTKKMDVGGRTVAPGFIDPHKHATGFIASDFPETRGIRLPPSEDRKWIHDATLDAIKKAVAAKKPGDNPWIIIYPAGRAARNMILFGELKRAEMDAVSPNNPVMINESGSSGANSQVTLNTAAHKLAEHEMAGLALLDEHAINELGAVLVGNVIKDVILKNREKDYAPSYRNYLMQTVLPDGIVAAGTRIPRTPLNSLAMLDVKGQMPIRFAWIFSDGSMFNPPTFYRRFPDLRGQGSKWLWELGNGEELTESPTTGPCNSVPWSNQALADIYKQANMNLCLLDNPIIRAQIKDEIAYGRGAEFHAAGDGTGDRLLAIIQEVQKENGFTDEQIRDKRITMEHLNMVRPDEIPLLKRYGILMGGAANYFGRQLDLSAPANLAHNVGEKYLSMHQPMKMFIDNGVRAMLAEDGNPLDAIQLYVTRRVCMTPRLPEQGPVGVEKCATIAKEQAIDRVTALRMATVEPAYYLLKENQMGSLEAGKFADFIVFDKDYFTVPEDQIRTVKVILTAIGGKVHFADPAFGPVEDSLWRGPEYKEIKRASGGGPGAGAN